MQNQTSYDRINTAMIARLNLFYNTRLSDEVVEAMVEDLSRFSTEALKEAFKKIRGKCKKMPSLAEVIEHCEKAQEAIYAKNPKPSVGYKKHVAHLTGTMKAEDHAIDDVIEIFSTDAGKLALELGVGFSCMVEYERTGKKDFEEDWVRRQHKFLLQGIADLEASKDSFVYKPLSGLLNTITERERKLYARFKQDKAAA